MKLLTTFFVAGAMAAGLTPSQAQSPMMSAEMIEDVRNSYIFVFDDSVSASSVQSRAAAMVAAHDGQLKHVYRTAIRGFSATMPLEAAERMAARNPNIAYYEADQVAFAFPPPPGKGPDQGDGGSTDPVQETPWGITRIRGGATYGGSGRAFIIDSGIDLDHPDLNVDVALSANFVSKGPDNGGDDGNGHGTHVAGTVAAIDNGIGVIGVAAGAPVVAVRVLDNRGSGSYSDVIAGIDYVARVGRVGDVANMSLGGGKSDALNAAVIAASENILFSLAAGNSSADANNYSPASAEGPNIWTVSAIDQSDVYASFSNWANPPIDCAGPGVGVLSTYKDGGYRTFSGTSMAAPHVAGILLTRNPTNGGTVLNDPDGNPDYVCSL